MANFELVNLDDKEFEVLACRLLSAELGIRFERFKPGRDSGVDGRYFAADRSETILQCKHWIRSSAGALIRGLEREELPKVQRLAPKRYVLATSVELSRSDKQKIAAIFRGFLHSERDVLGIEDVNDLLVKHPEVVKAHPSLWLASAEVIGLIQNAAILGRSDFSLEQIRLKATRYVETKAHAAARAKLEALGVVLITGLPGIGKTTLAEQLCLEHVLDGYQLCVLGEAIEEAEAIFKKDKRQVFYFDDFLGRNYLEALGRHEDSRIVGFMRRIQSDATKRFVLTTRTTVLNQAKLLSDQFDIGKVNRTELEIRFESLDLLDRARILHKHVWHSNLDFELISELLSSRRYLEVVKHPNFNPRLIQFITDAQRYDQDHTEGYWGYVKETLANPAAVWRHVLENQLDDHSRILLLLCCFNGKRPVSEPILRSAFSAFKNEPIARGLRGSSEFVRNTRLVSGSVLNRILGAQHTPVYTLFNPSVADYVYANYAEDSALLSAIFRSLKTYESLDLLNDLIASKYLSPDVAIEVLSALAQCCLDGKEDRLDYQVTVLCIVASRPQIPSDLQTMLAQLANAVLQNLNDEFSTWEAFATLMIRCLKTGLVRDDQFVDAFRIFSLEIADKGELEAMAELYAHLDSATRSIIEPQFKRQVLSSWQDGINTLLDESGALDGFLYDDETDEASEAAAQYIQDGLNEYPLSFSPAEIKSVLDNVDLWDFIRTNQRRESRDPYEARVATANPVVSDEVIVELFDMDFPR